MRPPASGQKLLANLKQVQTRISAACIAAQRDPQEVTLIGASKTRSADEVLVLAKSGLTDFGENYLDETEHKIPLTHSLDPELRLTWHYIGRMQSNKTSSIAHLFDWVHTLDRLKIAKRLNDQCPAHKKLNVLLQVNISADPAKGGLNPNTTLSFLESIQHLPNLRIRGLMTILAQAADARASYQSMAQLFTDVRQALNPRLASSWDTLSMGMTDDLEHAIAAGATHVRIGTALFGERGKFGAREQL